MNGVEVGVADGGQDSGGVVIGLEWIDWIKGKVCCIVKDAD